MSDRVGSRALPLLGGLVLNAYGAALIIMSGIGIRVVDLLALSLVRHVGTRFYLAKLSLEASFLLTGFLLGGPVGIAALAFVCVVGPFMEPLIWANRRFLNLPDYGLQPCDEPQLRMEGPSSFSTDRLSMPNNRLVVGRVYPVPVTSFPQ